MSWATRRNLHALHFVLLVCLVAGTATAQTIKGVVVNAADRPVASVVVLLLDNSASTVARTLTNERGEFRLVAPAAGSYRLRTLRIGMRPMLLAAFSIGTGEDYAQRITLSDVIFSLDTVRVSNRSVCRLEKDSAAATFAVWEQARAALSAATVAANDRSIVSTVVTYQRILDAGSHRVLRQLLATRTDSSTEAWTSVPVESLHSQGYVIVSASDSATYRAPSLDMLASEQFAEDHCFHLVNSPEAGKIGIAFEPTAKRRRVTEVTGTLWLDRATSELRAASFQYANVGSLAFSSEAGGTLEFARSADGTWVITRWSIRMPVTDRQITVSGARTAIQSTSRVVLSAIREVGGELALSLRAPDTLWAHPPLIFAGTVVDSATAAPASRARVALIGTDARTIADTLGMFSLPGVLPGDYTLEIHTTSLDSLHAVQHIPITLLSGAPPSRVRVSNARAIANASCRASAAPITGRLSGIIVGTVEVGADTLPLSNIPVVAEWIDGGRGGAKKISRKTDDSGRFLFCGVPINVPITVRANRGEVAAIPRELTIAMEGHFALTVLTLDQMRIATAVFSGLVVDSAGTPVVGVEVAFPTLQKTLLTSDAGTFRFPEVSLGPQDLRIRKIGWGPLDTILNFSSSATVNRRIVLTRVTTLDKVETVAAANRMREFEENRRLGLGHFFTDADVERTKPALLEHLLATTSGLKLLITPAGHAYVVTSRGVTTLTGRACGPKRLADVYLDNVRLYSGKVGDQEFNVNSIDPKTIAGIEYYASAAQTPGRYQNLNAVCGVLVIWTKR